MSYYIKTGVDFSTLRKYINAMSFKDYGLALCKFIALVPFASLFFMPIFSRLDWNILNEAPNFYIALLGALIAAKSFISRIKVRDVVIFLIIAFFFYISPLIYPLSARFIEEKYVSFVWMVIPFYFVGKMIDFQRDKTLLLIIARLGFVFQILYQVFASMGYFSLADGNDDYSNEQMGIAYGFLFCVMYELVYGIAYNSKFDRFLSLLGIVLVLFMGARGPVVTLLVFIVGFFLYFYKFKSYQTFKRLLLVTIGIVVYFFMNPILLGLSFVSQSLGLSTRVLDSILVNEFINYQESNGRDDIYQDIWIAIQNDSSGLGYGLGGDRLFTSHVYAHNFEMEILVSFGLYIGGFLLLALFYIFLKCVLKIKDSDTCAFWFCLFCFGFLPIQFSGTWINSPEFFLLLGYSLSLLNLDGARGICSRNKYSYEKRY